MTVRVRTVPQAQRAESRAAHASTPKAKATTPVNGINEPPPATVAVAPAASGPTAENAVNAMDTRLSFSAVRFMHIVRA